MFSPFYVFTQSSPRERSVVVSAAPPSAGRRSSAMAATSSFFLIWTTPPHTFQPRFMRSVESIFRHHPAANVTLLSNSLPDEFFARLTAAGLRVPPPGLAAVRASIAWAGARREDCREGSLRLPSRQGSSPLAPARAARLGLKARVGAVGRAAVPLWRPLPEAGLLVRAPGRVRGGLRLGRGGQVFVDQKREKIAKALPSHLMHAMITISKPFHNHQPALETQPPLYTTLQL